jgi:hypothetical protein
LLDFGASFEKFDAMTNKPMDKRIIKLVNAFAEIGIQTCASCEGHGFPFPTKPYVTFKTQQRNASALARLLRTDAESSRPKLHWGWTVEAGFDDKFEIFYRLTTENPHRKRCGYGRHWIDLDISRLPVFVQEIFQRVLVDDLKVKQGGYDAHNH